MKILIAEDDPASRQLMEHLLAPVGDCQTAANGLEALETIEQAMADDAPFDLVCLDVMMPEMDGMEALQKIRRLEFKYRVKNEDSAKIIMITAKGQAKDMMDAFHAGCEAYLVKPVSQANLFAQLAKLGLSEAIDGPDA